MNRWGIAAALVVAGVALAGCGGGSEPAPAPVSATSPAVATPAAPTWSHEATTACRTFVNSVPNMALVKSQLGHYRSGMTDAEYDQLSSGWSLATAGMTLPSRIGQNAEPAVHDALADVGDALELPLADTDAILNGQPAKNLHPAYVEGMNAAFSSALTVCGEVGVTAG